MNEKTGYTPKEEAEELIKSARNLWTVIMADSRFATTTSPTHQSFDAVLEEILKSPLKAEEYLHVTPKNPIPGFDLIPAILAYSKQSIQAQDQGNMNEAWVNANQATYFSGAACILINVFINRGTLSASDLAKIRNKENIKFKDYVIQYWKEKINHDLSAQKAADIILKENIVNLSHKKIAEYISKEKKKMEK